MRVEIRLPESHSLKSKRALVKPILENSRRRFSVAAAEVAHQDRWQRATLAMAVVASSASHAGEVLDRVERYVWAQPEIEVLETHRTWMESDA